MRPFSFEKGGNVLGMDPSKGIGDQTLPRYIKLERNSNGYHKLTILAHE